MIDQNPRQDRIMLIALAVLGAVAVSACNEVRRGAEVEFKISHPFTPDSRAEILEFESGGEAHRFTYHASMTGSAVEALNVFLVVPDTTFVFDPVSRRFSTMIDYSDYRTSGALQANADFWRLSTGANNFVYLSTPGSFGSSGTFADLHQASGVTLMDEALDRLKARHGATTINIAGQSSAAAVVAALIARRDDLGCVVVASGAYDQSAIVSARNWPSTYLGVRRPLTFEDITPGVRPQAGRRIVILADREDEIVDPSQSQRLFEQLGGTSADDVSLDYVQAAGPHHHDLSSEAIRRITGCAARRA